MALANESWRVSSTSLVPGDDPLQPPQWASPGPQSPLGGSWGSCCLHIPTPMPLPLSGDSWKCPWGAGNSAYHRDGRSVSLRMFRDDSEVWSRETVLPPCRGQGPLWGLQAPFHHDLRYGQSRKKRKRPLHAVACLPVPPSSLPEICVRGCSRPPRQTGGPVLLSLPHTLRLRAIPYGIGTPPLGLTLPRL